MNSKALSILVVVILVLLGIMLFMGRTIAPTDVEVNTLDDTGAETSTSTEETLE